MSYGYRSTDDLVVDLREYASLEKHNRFLSEALFQTADKLEQQPSWMERPSKPGMWVCIGRDRMTGHDTVLKLTQFDIDRGAPFHTSAVFGPIPEPDSCACGRPTTDGTGYCVDCFGG